MSKALLTRVEKLERNLGLSSEIEAVLAAGLPEGNSYGDAQKSAQQDRYWRALFQRYTLEEIVAASWEIEHVS